MEPSGSASRKAERVPRRGRASHVVALVVQSLVQLAGTQCGTKTQERPDAAATLPMQRSLDDAYRTLADPRASRDMLVAASEQMGAAAVVESGTARAVAFATVAGELRLRSYRLGYAQVTDDARRAVEWWSLATGRLDLPEVCRPARLRAEVLGELAHDVSVTYAELYAARRRMASTGCVAEIDAALERVAQFRPAPSVLEHVDRQLAAEGTALLAPIASQVQASSDAAVRSKVRTKVLRVARWSTADSARVLIELDGPATYRLQPAAPDSVRVLLENVELHAAAGTESTFDAGKGLLTGGALQPVPSGGRDEVGTELVLSLAKPAYRRVFVLPDPVRVVVDLSTRMPSTEAQPQGPRPLRRVVLDAGHGGTDPGAIGPNGLREKDVTLAIVRAAAPILARELGVEVRLTRSSDTFVSLEERAAAANAFEADVFLSVHCNATEARSKRGIEIYVLDTERDEIASRVARRENGGGGAAPSELRAILDDLKLAELGSRSRELALLLSKSAMASITGAEGHLFSDMHDGGVHGAGFFVLVGARMPAALLEVAYISNPVEEGYLGRRDFRARVVDAIVNGLRAYKEGRSG